MKLLHRLVCILLVNVFFMFNYIVSHAGNNIPSIYAESGIVYCINTGQILYEKNIHNRQYPASITKVLTASLALNKNNLDDTIVYSDTAVYSIERDSSHLWVVPGEEISVKDSLYGLLLRSGNEIANGLAEKTSGSISEFIQEMNAYAKKLGAKDTNFENPNGLTGKNHYTTAYDMALIAADVFKNTTFREIISTKIYTIPATNKNVERIIGNSHKMLLNGKFHYPGCLGGKTGYTVAAGNTLITYAEKDGMQLVAVGLKSNPQNTYLDVKTMLDYAFNNYKLITLVDYKQATKEIPIYHGTKKLDSISALSTNKLQYAVPIDFSESSLKVKYELPEKLTNSVEAISKVGSVNYILDNQVIASTELVSNKKVEVPKSIFDDFSVFTLLQGILNFILFIFYICTILVLCFTLFIIIAKIFNFKIKIKRNRA